MKRYILFIVICLFSVIGFTQKQLPSIQLENLKGEPVNSLSILDDGVPVVISFWSTICKPCLRELDAFAEHFEAWQEDVKFNIAAVSTDDARSMAKVRTLVASNGWSFTILLDKNQNFKRALNVSIIPHLYIVDSKGKIVYSRIGYTPGSEMQVLEVLKSLE